MRADVGGRLLAVRRGHALDELLAGEGVLLGAHPLHDVRREHAADLRGPLVAQAPLQRREEAGAASPTPVCSTAVTPGTAATVIVPAVVDSTRTPSLPSVTTWVPTRDRISSGDQPVFWAIMCDSY